MQKKNSAKMGKIILIGAAIVALGIIMFALNSGQKNTFQHTFYVDATYDNQTGIVQITFKDFSQSTTNVSLEILGMENTYHKSFDKPEFVEFVNFGTPPKYGWKAHPVVFTLRHPEFGTIEMKTEIHNIGQPAPLVIFSNK